VANSFTAFFETLVAGAGEYNAAKMNQVALLDAVYKDVKPEAARIGKTVDVYFPDVGPFSAVNNGQLTASNVAPNYVPLVFQNRVGKALQFQDFEQWQTATELAQKFFDPLYKRAQEYLNGQIASLLTPTNFNYNPPLIGLTQSEVTVTDAANAWSVMADNKVPMNDSSQLKLLVHNNVYRKQLTDTAWVQENVVGRGIAEMAREKGKLSPAFQFEQIWDQQMPTTFGRVITGSVALTNGSTAVTGTATGFTSDLTTANFLIFGNDPTNTVYSISSITNDGALVLGSTYSGATVTATSAKVVTQIRGTVTTAASTSVTGSSTHFTADVSVGQWLTFSGDTTQTPYQIASITNDTTLVLVTAYAGTTGSGMTVLAKQYTSAALHEYAIALALRPIATPKEAADVVAVTYLDVKGIPMRVMVSYVHIYQALFVTVDFGFAIGVIRPDFGVLIQS
jgi:hypothetical protein